MIRSTVGALAGSAVIATTLLTSQPQSEMSSINLRVTPPHMNAMPASAARHCQPAPPIGFRARDATVGGERLHYLIGGHGPTVVLLHGYPETSYEWYRVMPALAREYTVIVPDLPGAGRSNAPRTGYDKTTMASAVHGLLRQLGRDRDVRIVGHDIGTMVAYAYAASHRDSVRALMLTEAPIPDKIVYSYPSLTENGPGFWNFGFFSLTNGLPEATIDGHESVWVNKFVDWLSVQKAAVNRHDTDVYACFLRDDAHLRASFEWFRAFPKDNVDVAASGRNPLQMPVLAVGADHSLGKSVGQQAEHYAAHVTTAVVPNSGHWIWEEQPDLMTQMTLSFLRSVS